MFERRFFEKNINIIYITYDIHEFLFEEEINFFVK